MKHDSRNLILAILGAFAAIVLMPVAAQAQCTTSYTGGSALTSGLTSVAVNMVDIIIGQVAGILGNVAENMYETIIDSPEYKMTLGAMLILYFSIYGVMLSLGMVQTSPHEVFTRFFKVAFIFALLTPGSWSFFYTYVYQFFFGGMLDIIREFNAIGGLSAGGTGTAVVGNVVSSVLGPVIAAFLSQNMIVTLTNTWHVGALGVFVNFFLLWGIVMLLIAIVTALATFIKSMVGLFFLFGLAPLFIICLLFEKTKKVFEGWLNQVISFTLQPIFVFAFLGFFVALIFTSLMNIMSVQWCVDTLFSVAGIEYRPFRPSAVPANAGCGTVPSSVTNNWLPLGATCRATGTKIGFPINIADVFIFVVLSYLAWKYCSYVSMIAQQLSGAMASGMANPAAMGQMMGRAMGGAVVGTGLAVTGTNSWARNRLRGDASQNNEEAPDPRIAQFMQRDGVSEQAARKMVELEDARTRAAEANKQVDTLAQEQRRQYQTETLSGYDQIKQDWKDRYGVELDQTGAVMADRYNKLDQQLSSMDPSDARYTAVERRRDLVEQQLEYYRTPHVRTDGGSETS